MQGDNYHIQQIIFSVDTSISLNPYFREYSLNHMHQDDPGTVN